MKRVILRFVARKKGNHEARNRLSALSTGRVESNHLANHAVHSRTTGSRLAFLATVYRPRPHLISPGCVPTSLTRLNGPLARPFCIRAKRSMKSHDSSLKRNEVTQITLLDLATSLLRLTPSRISADLTSIKDVKNGLRLSVELDISVRE